jgi:GT2 family glycosyltransferase
MKRHSVSIIYVNYKTPDLLNEAISSVKKHTQGCDYEIIVVDNHSQDHSREIIFQHHKEVIWIDAGYNSGFARGNNMGIAMARNEFVLIINSDTRLENDAISSCLQKFAELTEKKENIGLLGCKIISFDGEILPSVHAEFHGIKNILRSNALFIKFFGNRSQKNEISKEWFTTNHFAEHLSGAFLLFKRSVLKEKKLWLDEDYFLYSEDVDWCYRLNKQGFRCYFYSDAYILHKNAASSPDNEKKNFQITISRWLFVFKAYGFLYFYLYLMLLAINVCLDDLLFFKKKIKKPEELEAHHHRRLLKKLMLKYGIFIPFAFKRSPSSSKQFLKYDKQI